MTYSASHLTQAINELRERQQEALAIYRPMQKQMRVHTSLASELVVRGGVRSGKSFSTFAEVSSGATQIPITGMDGQQIPFKYPTNRPLLIWVIGKGEDHIGDTIYRLFFEPGQFYVLRDLSTGLLRAFNPEDPADVAREEEKEPGPPLIPHRFLINGDPKGDSFAWEDKRRNLFSRCTLTNGTKICAFTSSGEVKKGDPVDIVLIDEDIMYPEYVAEWLSRLSDRKGRLLWAAWPYSDNTALCTMSERAEKQKDFPKPDIEEVHLVFSENPHIDANEKRKRREAWAELGETEIRSRDQGEFTHEESRMYPNFAVPVHCTPRDNPTFADDIDRDLELYGFEPPNDWCRRLFLDPGHTCTAVLFVATPPPPWDWVRVFYDELYLRHFDAFNVAKEVRKKAAGHVFQDFVIDFRYGRQSISGMGGKTFAELYADGFAAAGLRCVSTGTNFSYASDDIDAGIESLRGWLRIGSNGRSILRIVKHNLHYWQREVRSYRKKITKNEKQNTPAAGQSDHLMDVSRYAAIHGCPYIAPAPLMDVESQGGPVYESFKNFYAGRQHPMDEQGGNSFSLGAGVATR